MTCNCSDESEEGGEQVYEAWMRAGELAVQVEGSTSEEAQEKVKELWDKAVNDVGEMNEEERRSVGLQ